ncbi:hypothetical protein J4434_08965 [Candidatus Woesearchaeota archaeon]|nr:hypothetical protein [Candidatus Woesearchaeota archaeon]
MAERKIVVDTLRLNYQGLFNLNEMYMMIDKWLREKGYDKFERKNFEHVYKDGRQVEVEIEPWKKFTDYAKCSIKLNMLCTEVKDVVVKIDGKNVKMNQGKVLMTFMGFLETDYEHRWEQKAILYFLRTIFDLWVYKINTDKFEAFVAEDTNH